MQLTQKHFVWVRTTPPEVLSLTVGSPSSTKTDEKPDGFLSTLLLTERKHPAFILENAAASLVGMNWLLAVGRLAGAGVQDNTPLSRAAGRTMKLLFRIRHREAPPRHKCRSSVGRGCLAGHKCKETLYPFG